MTKKNQSEQVDLRLTPTTLRRVVKQREKLEEDIVEFKSEIDRLTKELEEHQHCGKKIEDITTVSNKYIETIKEKELENTELKSQLSALQLAFKSSEQMNIRFRERHVKMDELQEKIVELEKELSERVKEEKSESQGITPEDFFKAIENFKMDQLMSCISERVFVHVVAPRTILQVGSSSSQQTKKEFKPNIPSDEKINTFIRKEIEPHFEMVFKTLDKTSESGGTSKATSSPSVEQQLAPDGTVVKTYAERFNSQLSAFIKKCIQDS